MWYTLGHEKTHLYPSFDPGRTAVTPGGPAVVQCLCVTPLSALARQCPRPDRPRECRDPGLRRSDGPQCYSCLPYSRPGLPATPVLRAAADPHAAFDAPRRGSYALSCTRVRAPLAIPPASGRWRWQPRWPMPSRTHRPHQWRKHSPRLGMPWRTLEAGQTLDHQSRSGIRSNKNGVTG